MAKQAGTINIKRRRRLIIWSTALLLLICLGWLQRGRLERAVIALVAMRQNVFTPPPIVDEENSWSRFWDKAGFYWDLSALRIGRNHRLKQFNPSLKPLIKELVRRQKAGESMAYSMNIYREIRWRLNFTPDTVATRERILELQRSLSQPAEQKLAEQQQPGDGSWALGIDVWYLRLYYSVDQAKDADNVKYRMSFLDSINSPEKLKARLDEDLYDNFTKTATFNREELDETFSAIARLLNTRKPIVYAFHPQLKAALRQYITGWQNPVTGCWGQWMVDSKGRVWKMDDMAMTFHVVSDFNGEVAHLDRIAKHALKLDKVEFPAGIRFDGSYENHLNWDVVTIMKFAWPSLDTATRKQARAEIEKMLNWCLTLSVNPDGSFKISELDDTLGDAWYYGVSFLVDAGYFDPKKRFWTNENFPGSKENYNRLLEKLKSTGLKDSGLRDAYKALTTNN